MDPTEIKNGVQGYQHPGSEVWCFPCGVTIATARDQGRITSLSWVGQILGKLKHTSDCLALELPGICWCLRIARFTQSSYGSGDFYCEHDYVIRLCRRFSSVPQRERMQARLPTIKSSGFYIFNGWS